MPRTSHAAVWTVKSARDTVEGQLMLIGSNPKRREAFSQLIFCSFFVVALGFWQAVSTDAGLQSPHKVN
jgi:hypothetical protein